MVGIMMVLQWCEGEILFFWGASSEEEIRSVG